jgi:hypothetical protein
MDHWIRVAKISARILFALLIVSFSLVLLNRAKSGAPAVAKDQAESIPKRRLFENRVPGHLPIKVKLKQDKEKLYRDLKNENWAGDFEIEVQNIGDKPIYSILFLLEVPDAKIADSYQAFSIVYGRTALADLDNTPTSDDIPIRPGEIKVMKLDDAAIRGWNEARVSGLVPHGIRGARLIFQRLSFGDGTGFEGTSGTPRSRKDNESTEAAYLAPTDGYGGSSAVGGTQPFRGFTNAGIFQPASFLPSVSNNTVLSTRANAVAAEQECNCVNSSCWHGQLDLVDTNQSNPYCYQCANVFRFRDTLCENAGRCYFWTFNTSIVQITGVRFIAKTTKCLTAQRTHQRHRTVRAPLQIPNARASMKEAFMIGTVNHAGRVQITPTTMLTLRQMDVLPMQPTRTTVSAASANKLTILVLTPLIAIGMTYCAIALTIMRPRDPVVDVIRRAEPVLLTNVAQGVFAIRALDFVNRMLVMTGAAAIYARTSYARMAMAPKSMGIDVSANASLRQ